MIRDRVRQGPSIQSTEQQHARGKLTVRDRLELLLDDDSFVEIGGIRRHRASGFGLENRRPYTDGVVTGWGTIDGRLVFVFAHDFRIFGGSLGEEHAKKIHRIMDMAETARAPLISLNDGAGARIQEGVTALAGYGGIFRRNVRCSGVIPQISVILGPCAGGAAYSPALTDFVFMVCGTSQMFITGPDVVRAVTGEKLLDLVPADSTHAYDMRAVVSEIVDDGDFFELHESWATNIICALARIDGHVVGIVANQPASLAGVLDINASEKGARFVQTCDAFNIPLVTLVDVPGFLPGTEQEHRGIIRHGAKLLYAYCNATVPRIQVILRKSYGGAHIVMDSLSIGADLSLAWPINEITVMGADGAASVIFRKEIAAAGDPVAHRIELIEEYRDQLMHPYYAAERGLVDDVIDPRLTRATLSKSLAMLRTKQIPLPHRKHGNPPV